jgi:hypothetical protein
MNDDRNLRRLTGAAVLLVASIAATVSYLHIYRLAVQALAAWLMPLSVDGTVGAASAALLSAARTAGERSPWTARVMLALGVLATLGANAYSGSTHGLAGMALAMWPGIAFIGSTETALGMTRRAARTNTESVSEAVPVATTQSVRERTARRTPDASVKRTRTAPITVADAALRYAPDLAAGSPPSMRRIRADLRVGQAKAQAIRAHLSELSTAAA